MSEGPAGATRRDGSLWAVAAGIVVAVVVGVLTDARLGSYVLAGLLAVCAVVRAVRPEPGPEALGVRRRWLDASVLGALAVAVGVLAAVVPTPV
ncbi:MAG TPA: DUF3017 domain-containing protein [Cellulomonas sp.]